MDPSKHFMSGQLYSTSSSSPLVNPFNNLAALNPSYFVSRLHNEQQLLQHNQQLIQSQQMLQQQNQQHMGQKNQLLQQNHQQQQQQQTSNQQLPHKFYAPQISKHYDAELEDRLKTQSKSLQHSLYKIDGEITTVEQAIVKLQEKCVSRSISFFDFLSTKWFCIFLYIDYL